MRPNLAKRVQVGRDIARIVLVQVHIGHGVTGTAETLSAIATNPIFSVLAADLVHRQTVAFSEAFLLPNGLRAELFAVPGKVPLYLENEWFEPANEGANIGVEISNGAANWAYVPGAAAITRSLLRHLGRADVVLFDGT